MILLALETSGTYCSVGLRLADGTVHTLATDQPREHTEKILPMISQLLAEHALSLQDCEGVVVSKGPGGFAALRVGASVAQALSFAADIPLYAFSSLQYLAQACLDAHPEVQMVFPAQDARMGQVYWGCYQRNEANLAQAIGEDVVIRPEAVSEMSYDETEGLVAVAGIGSGWMAYGDVLEAQLRVALGQDVGLLHKIGQEHVTANDLIRLALAYPEAKLKAEELELNYVRQAP